MVGPHLIKPAHERKHDYTEDLESKGKTETTLNLKNPLATLLFIFDFLQCNAEVKNPGNDELYLMRTAYVRALYSPQHQLHYSVLSDLECVCPRDVWVFRTTWWTSGDDGGRTQKPCHHSKLFFWTSCGLID